MSVCICQVINGRYKLLHVSDGVLQGIRAQVAYAMYDKSLRKLFDPQIAVKKYLRQIEIMLKTKPDK